MKLARYRGSAVSFLAVFEPKRFFLVSTINIIWNRVKYVKMVVGWLIIGLHIYKPAIIHIIKMVSIDSVRAFESTAVVAS